MSRRTLYIIIGLALWIAWCVVVITELVPRIRLHLTMWPEFIAYILSVAPVVATVVFVVVRSEQT